MPMRRTLYALAAVAVAAVQGCGPKDYCARVLCSVGRTCDPSNGLCVLDGSAPGDHSDGGQDAGVDAGVACSSACGSPLPYCDLSSGVCVECLEDTQCACPTSLCNPGTHACETADAGVGKGGDACASVQPLAFPKCQSSVTFVVDTSVAADDSKGSCSAPTASSGRDVVYSLTLAAAGDLTVTTRGVSTSTDPVLYVRRGACDTGTELACKDEFTAPERVKLKSLEAGTYYLFIDSYAGVSAGPTEVTVELGPPTLPRNETCATAEDVVFASGANTSVFEVDTSTAMDDTQGTCNPTPQSPEAVYRLSLPIARSLTVAALGLDGGATAPVLYLRAAPCNGTTELACVVGGSTPVLQQYALQAGDYFLFVEGAGAAGAGPTQVSVTTGAPIPPPPNDTCAAPRLIEFPPGVNTVSIPVDPSPAKDDYMGSCNAGMPDSREVVFRLSLPAQKFVEVTSQAVDGGTADPVIYLRDGPCGTDAGTELGCDDMAPGTPEYIGVRLPAGDYFLFVEGYGPYGTGPTLVTVTLSP